MTSPHPFPFRRGMRATLTLPDRVVEFVVLNAVVCADGVVRLVFLTDTDSDPTRLDCDDDYYPRADACTPVDCGATRGELLEAVREAAGVPHVHIEPEFSFNPATQAREVVGWCVHMHDERNMHIRRPTEMEALLAAYAYAAAPRSTP